MAENGLPETAPEAQFKVCRACGISKPADREHFGLDWSDPHRNRLRPRCLICLASQAAAYRKKNPGVIAAQKARQRAKLKWSPENECLYPLRRCTKCKQVFPNNPEH